MRRLWTRLSEDRQSTTWSDSALPCSFSPEVCGMLPLLESARCEVCGGAHVIPFHVIRNRHNTLVQKPYLALLGCKRCGVVSTWPRPTEEDMKRFYDADVAAGWRDVGSRKTPRSVEALERKFEPKRVKVRLMVDQLLGWFDSMPRASERRSVLDFGCGAGLFLDALQDRGWHTVGVEPHRLREFVARRHEVATDIPDGVTFDLVILHHVLEHLLAPVATLRRLVRATRPQGWMFCAVPDLGSVHKHGDFHYVSSPVHINGFCPRSLRNVLRLAGWRPVRTIGASDWSGFEVNPGIVDGRVPADAPWSPVDGRTFSVLAQRPRPGLLNTCYPPQLQLERGAVADAALAVREWGRTLDVDGQYPEKNIPPSSRGTVWEPK